MIVCSCNVISDHDVRNVVSGDKVVARTAGQVYGCLGCSAQCGRCARTIRQIMTEALGPCAKSCCDGCPHSAAADHAELGHDHRSHDHHGHDHPVHSEQAELLRAEAAA
jgi:bacterioferritin-associated ferredoxin